MEKQAMAAQFTEVTLEEMDKFLKRGWRVYRPKQSSERGEICYDLLVSEHVSIRVLTSIGAGRSSGADVGADAIRIILYAHKLKRPLLTGKAPIVKRTQNWRNSLQDRIEDAIELYESREGYFETRAGGQPQTELFQNEKEEAKPAEAAPEPKETAPEPEPPRPRSDGPLPQGTFTMDRVTRDWDLRVDGNVDPGDRVLAVRKDGRKQTLTVRSVKWRGRDQATGRPVTIVTFDSPSRNASDGSEDDL